jgi:hypothetical protein
MSSEPNKVIERSVDSVSTIYAIVIALALTQSIQTLIARDPNGGADLSLSKFLTGAPAFLAFLVTLVPFWHGMNRHLDRCYLEKPDTPVQGALLIDFGVFFVEASLLFVSGWSLRTGLVSFYSLGLLLTVDVIWGFISHQIHFPRQKSHVKKWAMINFLAGFVALCIVAYPFAHKAWILMVVAIGRSVVDYGFCWDFYFPGSPKKQ